VLKIVGMQWGHVVVRLTSHEQKKEAISPAHPACFFLRQVDKVGLISMNIVTHIILRVAESGYKFILYT